MTYFGIASAFSIQDLGSLILPDFDSSDENALNTLELLVCHGYPSINVANGLRQPLSGEFPIVLHHALRHLQNLGRFRVRQPDEKTQ